ncbi:MAG: hypothetical protein R3A48_15210 [Polyangiales bacterium]
MRSLLAALLCLGCISTNRATLDETAALFHDDLRWGRIPVAEGAVEARAREAFQQHHRGWGREVRVVDLDVDSVRLASTTGSLRVRVTWVGGTNSTDVRESVVEERWVSTDGNWRLAHEAIIAGDETLFPAAAPAATPTETPSATPSPAPSAQKPTRPRRR